MHLVDTRSVSLMEGWLEEDTAVSVHDGLVLHRHTDDSSVVMEITPGRDLGTTVQPADQILLVMAGDIEITVDTRQQIATPGTVIVAPASTPHRIRNVGRVAGRLISFTPDGRTTPRLVGVTPPMSTAHSAVDNRNVALAAD